MLNIYSFLFLSFPYSSESVPLRLQFTEPLNCNFYYYKTNYFDINLEGLFISRCIYIFFQFSRTESMTNYCQLVGQLLTCQYQTLKRRNLLVVAVSILVIWPVKQQKTKSIKFLQNTVKHLSCFIIKKKHLHSYEW